MMPVSVIMIIPMAVGSVFAVVEVYVFRGEEVATKALNPISRFSHPFDFALMRVPANRTNGHRRSGLIVRGCGLIKNGRVVALVKILVCLEVKVVGKQSSTVSEQLGGDGAGRLLNQSR